MNNTLKNIFSELQIRTLIGLAYPIITLISKTLRLKLTGANPILDGKKQGKNYIFAFWHDQFFIMPHYYVKYIGKAPISVLTSRSKDGEYISRLLHKFGFNTARGSSSLGGDTALRLLIKEIENGNDVAVTPDGPRGPRHIVQNGIITLSALTGCAIVPVGYKLNKKKTLNTWDKFIIPSPFSFGTFTVAKPLFVPKDLPDIDKENIRLELEKVMVSISES